jgi:hypothetical protein
MDITLECNVSLSKKLRSVIGESEGRVVLVIDPVRDGKGSGSLLISGDSLNTNAVQQALLKETNIQFTPVAIKDNVPQGVAVSNLFSTGDLTSRGARTPVDRVAATTPPSKGEVSHAIQREAEVSIPEAFPEYKDKDFTSFVTSFEELMMAVKAAQGKEAEIDPDSIENPRQRAIAIEMKEQAEAIDIPAYVVNDSCSSVTLNDIDLSLNLNMPINLANISAKRIGSSGDLKSMLRSGVIKFIDPNEVDEYRVKAESGVDKYGGLETYSRDEAFDAMAGSGPDRFPEAEQVDIPVNDTAPSEQEQLAGLIDLSGGEDVGIGVRTSFHGSGANRSKKTIGNSSETNEQGLKTISRA